MSDQPTLTLLDLAALAARMDAGTPRDQVLAESGVTADDWAASQSAWLQRMADQATQGRFALHKRYVELFNAYRAEADLPDRLVKRSAAAVGFQAIKSVHLAAPGPDVGPFVPALTVQQFAAIRAELATTSEPDHDAVRERYGLDAQGWLREEAGWHERLNSDRALLEQYLTQFRYMRGLLAPR